LLEENNNNNINKKKKRKRKRKKKKEINLPCKVIKLKTKPIFFELESIDEYDLDEGKERHTNVFL